MNGFGFNNLSIAKKYVDNMEISNDNLIENGDFHFGTHNWIGDESDTKNANMIASLDMIYDKTVGRCLSAITTNITNFGNFYCASTPFKEGENYIISFSARSDSPSTIRVGQSNNLIKIKNRLRVKNGYISLVKNIPYNKDYYDGNFDEPLTLVANSAPEGKKFSHWEVNGRKASVSNPWTTNMPMIASVIIAIYVDTATPLDTMPSISFLIPTQPLIAEYLFSNNRMIWTVYYTKPEGITVTEMGVLMLQSNVPVSSIDYNTPSVIRGKIANLSSSPFYIRKNNIIYGDTWYGRPYMIYKDNNSVSHTIYGEMNSATFVSNLVTASVTAEWKEFTFNIVGDEYESPLFFFLNEANKKYYFSNVKVERGNKYTGWNSHPNDRLKRPKYNLIDNLTGLYSGSTVETFVNPTQLTQADIYAKYDALIAAHSAYVTKTLLGTVDSLDIYEYTFTPLILKQNIDDGIPQVLNGTMPSVILTSGVHGDEKGAVISLYNVFKLLCDSWQTSSILEFFRFNVIFHVVPIVNPVGFNSNTRLNGNGVDVNRNFSSGWVEAIKTGSSSLSEVESQLIDTLMLTNTTCDFLIDFHNMNANSNFIAYALAGDYVIEETINKTIGAVTRNFAVANTDFPQGEDVRFGFTMPKQETTLGYQAEYRGIKSCTLETIRQITWQTSPSNFDELTIKFGTELLINVLKNIFKNVIC